MGKIIQIMDENQMDRSLSRLAHEIIEKNDGLENIALLGIKRRGVPLAKRLAKKLKKFVDVNVPVGEIDITLYRDDLSEIKNGPRTKSCQIPVSLKNHTIILVDDVLYTGRTVRAAIDAIFDVGRPISIQLAILIDRGHRELPIRPDYIGKNIPTSKKEIVHVELKEIDDNNQVYVQKELN
ncbi:MULTISPECIES: bifunctional pyr operon transcriptional regulator/uracil phosphoribosyltransferase PyrR [Terrabacteria group]|uniref:bifunctional pyr operon transcriptional regulator/uracil phosphoribosyltransferase PyrR n=1 Tax=Bacillati TaxID=1783272 RepID=UPI001939C216|nr:MULTISPECIES: bifunctional pyr operon transcriptional regulator/uracil phosphoribosyltransferase PyrR [Terrabacteria group]MBW9212961.1 bifunctional pyr operon transcriptional regulator/uracil phosphoribosyltransferase PyrR [Trueperella sp. zg.1013]QRG87020.1 bifunctional pyr operon transcriptional regulator/uracil phosphoribosyltransferase PyrR [Bulleidia sp. zg-1006]